MHVNDSNPIHRASKVDPTLGILEPPKTDSLSSTQSPDEFSKFLDVEISSIELFKNLVPTMYQAYSEFIQLPETQEKLQNLSQAGGWKEFIKANPQSANEYEIFRLAWLTEHQKMCLAVIDLGCFSANGTPGPQSDIDTQYEKEKGMGRLKEIGVKILFDKSFYQIFEASSTKIFDTECYLHHPGMDKLCLMNAKSYENFAQLETLFPLVKILGVGEKGEKVKATIEAQCGKEMIDLAQKILEPIKAVQGDSLELLDKRCVILTKIGKKLDILEASLVQTAQKPNSADAQDEIQIKIKFLEGIYNLLLGDTYATHGALAHAVGVQKNLRSIEKDLDLKNPEALSNINRRKGSDRKLNQSDQIGGVLENLAMFYQHSGDPLDMEKLISASKYITRLMDLTSRFIDSSATGTNQGTKETIKSLKSTAYSLEALKRKYIPPEAISTILTEALQEWIKTLPPKEKASKNSLDGMMKTVKDWGQSTATSVTGLLTDIINNEKSQEEEPSLHKNLSKAIAKNMADVNVHSGPEDRNLLYEATKGKLKAVMEILKSQYQIPQSFPRELDLLARHISGSWDAQTTSLDQELAKKALHLTTTSLDQQFENPAQFVMAAESILLKQITPLLTPLPASLKNNLEGLFSEIFPPDLEMPDFDPVRNARVLSLDIP